MKVGVIGAGVMGEALITALISYRVNAKEITISEKRTDRVDELVSRYGISVEELSNNVRASEILLLVVKPQDMADLLRQISADVKASTTVVSFAAGKKIDFISAGLGGSTPVIRVMPNTPTLVGAGMAAISVGAGVSSTHKDFVAGFLAATGKVVEVNEDLQDAVTATSGSGPAYFFAFVEAMIEGAMALGLSKEVATELTVQTFVGSAKLLQESGKSATTLRENVTSPNGTTAAALASFSANDLSNLVSKAMESARNRSIELA
jgi:pyrroline-5-carboxylate reductase